MAETVLNIDPSIDLRQCILWQYQNSPKLKSLIQAKHEWYLKNHTQFWQDWYNNVFNLDTANDFGLSVWGEILQFNRNVLGKDGLLHYLTTEQYRMVLKGQMLKFGMGCSAPEINQWLSVVFKGKGAAYCIDSYDMTAIPFVLRSEPDDEIKWLLGNIDFFPRPAGVGYQVRVIPEDILGFNGSELETFDNGVFSNDYSDVLQPEAGTNYQLSINAPQGVTVKINGAVKNYALIANGDAYTWSAEKDGYISASGSGTVSGHDTNIIISQLSINNTSGVGNVYINNTNATGALFVQGTPFTYSYSVGESGYIPLSGSNSITDDYSFSVSRLLISATPSDSVVTLNNQTARGAFFITGNTFEYQYTVSYPGLISNTGSGSTTSNKIVVANPYSGSFSIDYLTTEEVGGVQEGGIYTVQTDGYISLVMAAEEGHTSQGYNGGSGAKATISKLQVSQGDILRFVKINGGYISSLFGVKQYGGCGIGMYINDVPMLAVGGGGTYNTVPVGGGGYVGGYGTTPGYSIDGNAGNSESNNLNNGDGEKEQNFAFGGSGYNALPGDVNVSYSYNTNKGYVNLTFSAN